MTEDYESSKTSTDELLERKGALEKTIQEVSSFPEEVSRPCDIPLSNVASISGRFVCTNDFIMPQDDREVSGEGPSKILGLVSESWREVLSERDKLSHKQVKKILQSKLDELNALIHDASNNRKGKQSHQQSPKEIPKAPQNVEEPSVMEIREFVDNDGNETRSEVVDMQKEMGGVGDVFEEIKRNGSGGGGKLADKSGTQSEVFAALERKFKEFDVLGDRQVLSSRSMDAETAFAYEMHAASNSPTGSSFANGDDLSFFDELERQEEHGRKEDKNDADDFGSTFKSGFLAARAKGKKKSSAKQQAVKGETASHVQQKTALQDTVVERM